MQLSKKPPASFFQNTERRRQIEYLDARWKDRVWYRASGCRLPPAEKTLLLAPTIRGTADAYFSNYKIAWHLHANHALSSQACCINFLMPLAEQPERLAALVGRALDIPRPEMIAVEEGPEGRPWFVGFEWNGDGSNYLREGADGKRLPRGANSTCADAIVRFKGDDGPETLLIEWKYTEKYGSSSIDERGNLTRTDRYKDLIFAPNGPIRGDCSFVLTDFFYEPLYQLLRQQMLSYQMEAAREGGATRVRVLHLSPSGNQALHRVTSPRLRDAGLGTDVFDVFRSLLKYPDRFVTWSIEDLFLPQIREATPEDPWASYLTQRYRFLFDQA